jgi:hypothetical protein
VNALDAGDQRAALPLAAYKRLYKIEHDTRDLDDDAKLAAPRAPPSRSPTSALGLPRVDAALKRCQGFRQNPRPDAHSCAVGTFSAPTA